MRKTNIFLVDDNLYFLNAAIDFLNTEESFNVLGYAVKGEEALKTIKNEEPDVVIVDYVMAGLNGLEITKILKTYSPAPTIVMVTQFDASDYMEQAIEHGADGFVPKSRFGEEIIPLIKSLV